MQAECACNVVFSHFLVQLRYYGLADLWNHTEHKPLTILALFTSNSASKSLPQTCSFMQALRHLMNADPRDNFYLGTSYSALPAWSLVNLCSFTSLDVIGDIIIYGVP